MFLSFEKRALILGIFFALGFTSIAYVLLDFQVTNAKKISKKADKSSFRKSILKATRGSILDCNNQTIARNMRRVRVGLDKMILMDFNRASLTLANQKARLNPQWDYWSKEQQKKHISRTAGLLRRRYSNKHKRLIHESIAYIIETFWKELGFSSPGEMRKRMDLDSSSLYKVLCKSLTEEDAQHIEKKALDYSMRDIFIFEEIQKRLYLYPNFASHIIGYTNYEGKGQKGIELYWETKLKGKDGLLKEYRDRYNYLAPSKPRFIQPPKHGYNIQLTLNIALQTILEEELLAALKLYEATEGAIVLINPHSGDILAMASAPSFHLNTKKGIQKASLCYAFQSTYEPGSTIKIISISGAINEKLVTPFTPIYCHNGYYSNNSVVVKDSHPASELAVEDVLAKSNNIGTYKIALQLGKNRFLSYLSGLGFAKKTGIALPLESSGTYVNPDNPTDFSHMTYGYAINVTALQMACAYSAIANGGELLVPQIIRGIYDSKGNLIQDHKREVKQRVLSKRTASQMRSMLARVVSNQGTARRAKVQGFSVAGKTGTAKKYFPFNKLPANHPHRSPSHPLYKKGSYIDKRYVVSFIGMLPAENPAFVCAVVIDDPKTTQIKAYGGTMAAPTFSHVATRVAKYMGLQPTQEPDSNHSN